MTVRRRAVPARLAACAALGTALLAGCGGAEPAGSALPARTAGPALVARAALARCPATTAPRVDGGLPALRLPCLGDGPAVDLGGLRGPAVVNLWWSGCAPCRDESPLLQRLHASGRVLVLGVDVEDPDDGLRFATAEGLHYPMLSDPHERVKEAGLLPGYPVTYFVDRAGRRVAMHPGGYSSAVRLRADVRRYLGVDVP